MDLTGSEADAAPIGRQSGRRPDTGRFFGMGLGLQMPGDTLFDRIARQADGLGPLYTRQACSACHQEALRGSGFVQRFALVLDDGLTLAVDQLGLPYGAVSHPFVSAGASIEPPDHPQVRVTLRLGQPVIGRGSRDDQPCCSNSESYGGRAVCTFA